MSACGRIGLFNKPVEMPETGGGRVTDGIGVVESRDEAALIRLWLWKAMQGNVKYLKMSNIRSKMQKMRVKGCIKDLSNIVQQL